jgi:predicted RNase H-like HicB family nuclease
MSIGEATTIVAKERMSGIFSGGSRVSVGLEEAPDGTCMAHGLNIPGLVAGGPTPEAALDALQPTLVEWLGFLASAGEPVPPPSDELEIAVDEWVRGEPSVARGESDACFEADRAPLSHDEVQRGLRILGSLRGRLLPHIRRARDEDLERIGTGEWNARVILDELARAQWWTLTRLGASPLAQVPDRVVARLDTAMALAVQQLTTLRAGSEEPLVLEGEAWTPRKVLRRLLWLEWALGGAAIHALDPQPGSVP